MADEEGGGGAEQSKKNDCPVCIAGAPKWIVTFSDLVTLLLTFFVLLLSFAKTETHKYEAALGSIRDAFGGSVLKYGEVIQLGKSPDDFPTMIESQEPIKPFPIEFLTMEGILDKHEINRESTETLTMMKNDLKEFALNDSVDIYEMPEGIKVRLKDRIYFKEHSVEIDKISVEIFKKLVKLLSNKKWTVFVEGHASRGEETVDGKDAFILSSLRAVAVARSLIRRGVKADRITTVFYGDNRPDDIKGATQEKVESMNRRVEFIIRKTDLRTMGHKVESM